MELAPTAHEHETGYSAFIKAMMDRYNALPGPIFETNATGLYEAYLASFPEGAERQYHTCNCCRQFIERFGHLATVNVDGTLDAAMWNAAALDTPPEYEAAMSALARLVRRAKITGPFLSSESVYGTPSNTSQKTGVTWSHFAVVPDVHRRFKETPLKTAFQAAAEKRQEFGSVMQALQEYPAPAVATALRILKDDHVQNSAAVLGQAQFLADLHATNQTNLRWKLIAEAPSGFCHPRSGMVATLLDDIVAGVSFEVARDKWKKKMHPLQYQRAQAAPTEGAIKAAEEGFAKLGAGPALRRRYATVADVLVTLWRSSDAPVIAETGLFGGLKTKGATKPPVMAIPPVTMTWERFAREVLPTAEHISSAQPAMACEQYATLLTAQEPDAVPIMQWDFPDARNPVSLFCYHEGSTPAEFGLVRGTFVPVKLVTPLPFQWGGGSFEHQGTGVILVLDGARDLGKGMGQSAIFSSMLKSEYHQFRSVIEAYSKANPLLGWEAEHVCGQMALKGPALRLVLRVKVGNVESDYRIDRWE